MISGLSPKSEAKPRSRAMTLISRVNRDITNFYPIQIDFHFVDLIDQIDFINTKLTLLTSGSYYPGDNYHTCPVFALIFHKLG